MLTFRFNGVEGRMTVSEILTSGMIGKEAKLEFSEEWDALTKTVVFTAGRVSRDVIDINNQMVTIPAEVLAVPYQQLMVGVYGVSADGKATPTLYVKGPMIYAGADPSEDPGADPDLPIWSQLQQQIDEKEQGTSGAAGVQSDWDQNDETAADYVKNRTHYAYQEILLPETKVTMTKELGQWKAEGSPEFYVGDLYIVTIDGVEYLCSFDTDRDGTVYYWDFQGENMPLHVCSYAAGLDYGMGVFIDFDGIDNPVYGTYTVSVMAVAETVKQLDEKYIPDSIARMKDIPTDEHIMELINNALESFRNSLS